MKIPLAILWRQGDLRGGARFQRVRSSAILFVLLSETGVIFPLVEVVVARGPVGDIGFPFVQRDDVGRTHDFFVEVADIELFPKDSFVEATQFLNGEFGRQEFEEVVRSACELFPQSPQGRGDDQAVVECQFGQFVDGIPFGKIGR